MRILLAGATGPVGATVARALVARGHFVSCMVRLGSEARLRLPGRERSERISGDVTDPDSLVRKPLGCDAAVNLVGIVREIPSRGQTFQRVQVEGVGNLIASCLESGVWRLVHVSALGAAPVAPDPFHRTKFQGEEAVRRSAMRWTVLRPSFVYGPGSPTLRWLARLTYGSPVLPVPVPALEGRVSPLWAEDLAEGIASCLERPATEGRTLEAPGPEAVTVAQLVAALARARGVAHWRVPVPAAGTRWLWALPGLRRPADALHLLGEDPPADPGPFVEATGVTLTPLERGLRRFWIAR